MNAKVMNTRLVVTVILAALGTGAAGWLVGCSSKSPLGSVGGDAGDAASSGSGGAGGVGAGGTGGVGAGGAGGTGGQSCPERPGAEGSACTAAQDGCSRCIQENVTCCREFRRCVQGTWSRFEAGPCASPDGGSNDTAPDTTAAVGPCPATSPGNSGATCAVDESVFCFYGSEIAQEQCRCLSLARQWQCTTVPCQRITASCAATPPASAVMCTEASSCDYCCSGGTAITTCTCQPGQAPSCRRTGSCGG